MDNLPVLTAVDLILTKWKRDSCIRSTVWQLGIWEFISIKKGPLYTVKSRSATALQWTF